MQFPSLVENLLGLKKSRVSQPSCCRSVLGSLFLPNNPRQDDRCFVTSSGDKWLCTREECKIVRSVHKNSDKASQFECDHVMLAKNPENSIAVAMYHPNISDYPCSDTVGTKLREVVSSLPSYTLPVVQVSEQSFAVFGFPIASNPLGFCHAKKEGKSKSGYICTAKDCCQFSLRGLFDICNKVLISLDVLLEFREYQRASPWQCDPVKTVSPQNEKQRGELSNRQPACLY